MKTYLLILLLYCSSSIFAQNYQYTFQLEGITTYGPAKLMIDKLRDLLGVTQVKFIDDEDLFLIYTHLDFEIEEMSSKFESNGLVLNGIITKVNVE